MNDLPPGWVPTTLGTVAPLCGGSTPKGVLTAHPGTIPFYKVSDMNTSDGHMMADARVTVSEEVAASLSLRICPPGSVIFPKVGGALHTDKKRVLTRSAAFDTNTMAAIPSSAIDERFLYYWLSAVKLSDYAYGSPVPQLSRAKLSDERLLLPPLQEQKRIVAAIEEQLSRLDAGDGALARVRRSLKRMRAAVLQSAVTGGLVKRHSSESTGEALLRDVLSAREKYLADHPHPGSRRLPAVPDAALLPPLPDDWIWATVDQLSTRVTDGVHKKPNYVMEGVPFVTVRNLTAGAAISFEHLNYVTPEDHAEFCRRSQPELGDLLLSKDGTLGVVRAVRDPRPFSIFVSVALIKPVLYEMTDYLEIALSSPIVQRQMVPKGTGLQHIHLEDLRADCIPLPPLDEQKLIVAAAQRELSRLEYLESGIESMAVRAAGLRSAILNAAFVGKLVPQHSGDEPALILLERIEAERASSNVGKPSRARGIRAPRESVTT